MLIEYSRKGLNRYKKRIDRYNGNTRYAIDTYEKFIFKNYTSINLPLEHFTNYMQRKNNTQFKEIFDGIISNPNYLMKKFISDELLSNTISDIKKINRLQNIIKSYISDFDIKQNPPIKFKNINNNAFQLYVKKENKDLVLYLIDLYHLGIIPKNKKNGEKFNAIEEYEKKSKYSHCVSGVININLKENIY